ncbi:MAG: hypothetical protein M3Y21_04740 [Candidatus Eremiobacteraeota bacterium]|nr:hypothetical protein [Candidatus Eremiobacteraeota bacterium]
MDGRRAVIDDKNKVDAVFELREAAQAVGRAEVRVEQAATLEHVDALLDAKLLVEEKTSQAIESCAHCGLQHCDHQRPGISNAGEKIIAVDFRNRNAARQPEQEGT